jgi:hypothetical protein
MELLHGQCLSVRRPGKACGAMAFALTFLLLFLSRKKVSKKIIDKKKQIQEERKHFNNFKKTCNATSSK